MDLPFFLGKVKVIDWSEPVLGEGGYSGAPTTALQMCIESPCDLLEDVVYEDARGMYRLGANLTYGDELVNLRDDAVSSHRH